MVRFATLVVAATVLTAAPASAAPATGGTTVRLDGPAAKRLQRSGVRIVAVEPAAASRRALELPVLSATLGKTARLRHPGVVQFKARQRRVNLTGLRTTVGRRTRTTARIGGRRVTLFTYGRVRPVVDAETVRFTAPVHLARPAAKRLQRRLKLRRAPAGRLGTAVVGVALRSTAPPPPPVVLPAPVTPAPQATGTLTWRPRESFVRYVNSGAGTTVEGGATDGPREVRPGSDAALVYSFGFPFAAGARDGGITSLAFTGTVRFRYPSHGIDLAFSDPQVRLGATSGDVSFGGVRTLELDLAAATRTDDGTTTTVTAAPARLTAEGASAFGGFYAAGDEFGSLSTSYTTTP